MCVDQVPVSTATRRIVGFANLIDLLMALWSFVGPSPRSYPNFAPLA